MTSLLVQPELGGRSCFRLEGAAAGVNVTPAETCAGPQGRGHALRHAIVVRCRFGPCQRPPRSPEFARQVFHQCAVDHVSLVQTRRKFGIAQFARSALAQSTERLRAAPAHCAPLAAPEVIEYGPPEFTAHDGRAKAGVGALLLVGSTQHYATQI